MTEPESLPVSSAFKTFLTAGLDRCAFIDAWLRARDIPHSVVELAGNKHIIVRFSPEAYDPRFRMKTLVAHYDRVPGTPGANDNSAACFQLMLFAERLASTTVQHNIRMFFTDGEEAAGTNGIAGQGSFTLGEGLRKLKMTEDDVYVFDACGRGDTLVVSTAGMDRKLGSNLASRLGALHERATTIALASSPNAWLRIPTPYSDNAGFLAAGIASQIITVLPHEEARKVLLASNNRRDFTELVSAISGKRQLGPDSPYYEIIPETWRIMHSEADNAATLTTTAFTLMLRFLSNLAGAKELAI